MHKLEIEHVFVHYMDKKKIIPALYDIHFSLEEGEFLTIIGPSGCGKTTLLKTIAGIVDYQKGNIFFNGLNANTISIKNRNLSYVFQNANLYPFLTIYHNIAMPLKVQKIPLDEIERRVKEVSNELDIIHLLSRKPKQISGGQQQKVAIAKALIKKPDLYLFDEPFSNLDPFVRIELRKELKRIQQVYHATMIFVTHDLNEALYLGDKIIVMDQGKIVQEGTNKEVVEHPNCSFVYDFFHPQEKK